MKLRRSLLTIGHSYCVALNRRLAMEMAQVGRHSWDVTVVAPQEFYGDLRPILLEPSPVPRGCLVPAPVYLSKRIHWMWYGGCFARTLRSRNWDVVHCWEEPYIVAGGQIAWWTPPHSVLVYSTFQNLCKRYPPPFNLIERFAMQRAAGWVAFGRTVEQARSVHPCYQTRAHRVIPLGVDLDVFEPNRQAGRHIHQRLGWNESGPPVIGFLGRFVPTKGLDLLMRVLDAMKTPWRALFVGGGPLLNRLKSWSNQYGDRVRIVTGIKHDDVPAWLNAMDVLCAPSQTTPHWREQFGRMLIEAFACGVPVVASNSGEIPYVVADAGAVVAEDDQAAWATKLTELLQDRSKRCQLKEKGLDRVRSHFAWPHIARLHLDFFEELLSAAKSGRTAA